MKKIICLFICGLVTLSSLAQNRMSYNWEYLSAGVGFATGPKLVLSPDLVAQYDLGGGFKAGAGIGLRFAMPCYSYVTGDSKGSGHESSYSKELDLPLFLRLSYGKERLGVAIDAGYALGLAAFRGGHYGSDIVPEKPASKDPLTFSGLFFEPRLNWLLNEETTLSLGLMLQHCSMGFRTVKIETVAPTDITNNLPAEIISKSTSYREKRVFVPAITLRYGFLF